jgi:hypothetical protein
MEEIVREAQETLVAVIHFGSHVSGASPSTRSAFDLLAIVSSYKEFYRRVHKEIGSVLSAGSLAALNRVLAPNIVHWRQAGVPARSGGAFSGPDPPAASGRSAKLFVVSESDLARALRGGGDHFLRGRLTQRVQIVYAIAPEAERRVASLLDENRRAALSWVLPFLEGSFDTLTFCSRMLEISYRGEIRPESSGRIGEVLDAQREFFRATYQPLLEAAVLAGRLEKGSDGYRACPAPRITRSLQMLQVRSYFLVSKARATLRWLKYLVTFEGWAPYVVAKIERRKGISVEISEHERRWPLVFLWPKLFRVMRARDAERNRPADPAERRGP